MGYAKIKQTYFCPVDLEEVKKCGENFKKPAITLVL